MDLNSPFELGKMIYSGTLSYYTSPTHDLMNTAPLVPNIMEFGSMLEQYEHK